MSEHEYRYLRTLLGGYLHQDWRDEFSTPDEAITTFKEDNPSEVVKGACKELDQIIPLVEQLQAPERFLYEVLWCYYTPSADGLTVSNWLRHVRKKLGCE
jgi:hypothetical protein